MIQPGSMQSQVLVHVSMMLAVILAATSFPVAAMITNDMPPSVLMFVRFLLASLLFLPLVVLKYGIARPKVSAMLRYGALSAPLATFFWCMFESLRYTSVINTGALYTLMPVFTAIAAYLINKEISSKLRKTGLLFGTVGALWVVFRGDISALINLQLNYGDLVFVLGCVAFSLYNPLIKRLHAGESTMVLTFWVLTCGSVWLLLLSIGSFAEVNWKDIDSVVYIGILYLTIFTTLLTFFIVNFSTIRIGATRVAAYNFLTPFLVIVISVAIGLDDLNVAMLPGVLLIVISLIIIQFEASYSRARRGCGPT